MTRSICIITTTFLCIACASCDESSHAHGNAASRVAAHVAPEGHGIIRGSVQFAGTAPPVRTFTTAETCCQGEPALAEETLVVNSNSTLRNTFVYLEDAPAVDGASQPPALLDQSHCRYVPHALGIQAGQTLRIHSSDPTMHNVHFNPDINPAKNFSMTQPGQETRTSFAAPEFVRMKCDVHPWMTAWVGVFDSPYFAVTSEDGGYEIKNVPPGTYKLVAWHELLGRQEQTVTIPQSADAQQDVQFVFGAQR